MGDGSTSCGYFMAYQSNVVHSFGKIGEQTTRGNFVGLLLVNVEYLRRSISYFLFPCRASLGV